MNRVAVALSVRLGMHFSSSVAGDRTHYKLTEGQERNSQGSFWLAERRDVTRNISPIKGCPTSKTTASGDRTHAQLKS